jgi:hypothetical protein
MALGKIVSGGQSGVDRGALDAALAADFPAGGWCPADRSTEDGLIPAHYPVVPLPHGGYPERTLQNVLDSDGTVILAPGELTGGTSLTFALCKEHEKPALVIDATRHTEADAAMKIATFVERHSIRTLNVAGPRKSAWPQSHHYAQRTIGALLERR